MFSNAIINNCVMETLSVLKINEKNGYVFFLPLLTNSTNIVQR